MDTQKTVLFLEGLISSTMSSTVDVFSDKSKLYQDLYVLDFALIFVFFSELLDHFIAPMRQEAISRRHFKKPKREGNH